MTQHQFTRLQNLCQYGNNSSSEEVERELEIIDKYLKLLHYFHTAGNRGHHVDSYSAQVYCEKLLITMMNNPDNFAHPPLFPERQDIVDEVFTSSPTTILIVPTRYTRSNSHNSQASQVSNAY